jgi:CPA2 family monovalent cation:H+ antiporter-2
VLLSMGVGVVLIRFNGAIAARLTGTAVPRPELPGANELQANDGAPGRATGRVGHTIAVLLHSQGIPFVAFDTYPRRVAQGRADGHAVSYGDIADPELQAAIHVDRAALVLLAVNDAGTALKAVTLLRSACPQVPVIARAGYLDDSAALIRAGAAHAYPEAIEASLRLGATALQMLRVPLEEVEQLVQSVRDWDYRPVVDVA